MKTVLLGFHIIVTIALVALILLQNSKGGLASGIGGGYRSRRGAERIIFTATIAVSILFLITSLLNLILR
ncbi:preprotein translocase subunit SecG [Candidatus Gottesmanbacteria bacterium RIFOXYB1_FULL_47_11]|uniref:Protein-export membrane protein SecG n=1 Tax=Candidatus Gottesmanbacteria bacterium RIFOXYB1_FULL_47_11 TaxID=1798401 RepID=A0A1F6BBW1_9BACT|nr:MAG: preprotein translocase subunit SecG [Candidatus Gottesmanbacteria bacterium RIFOXYB1_FULL_47_11]